MPNPCATVRLDEVNLRLLLPCAPLAATSWLITEGFHTKMEMLSRRAFGFRNFENYRMRVLAQCGWNGIINRVE